MWVRDRKTGKLIRERDIPDVCLNGHVGQMWIQHSWCPECNRPTYVFRCNATGCHVVTAIPEHYRRDCTPAKPVWIARPQGASMFR